MKGRRIRELTSVVQKRFKFPEGSVELYAEKVRGLQGGYSGSKGVDYKQLLGCGQRGGRLLRGQSSNGGRDEMRSDGVGHGTGKGGCMGCACGRCSRLRSGRWG